MAIDLYKRILNKKILEIDAMTQRVGKSETFTYVLTTNDPSSHQPHLHICMKDTKSNRKKMVDDEFYSGMQLIGLGRVVLKDEDELREAHKNMSLKDEIKYSPLDIEFEGKHSNFLDSRLDEIANWLNKPNTSSPNLPN